MVSHRISKPQNVLRLIRALLLGVPLVACLQGVGSNRGFDFTEATPILPYRNNAFVEVSRSDNHLINQMSLVLTQLVTIRVDDAGRHQVVMRNSAPRNNAPAEVVMPARYFALPENPAILAIRFSASQFATLDGGASSGGEEAYLYVFVEKTADIVQILPFNRSALTAWRPANDVDQRLREGALALPVSRKGQDSTVLIEDVGQLELALRTASRLPATQRATLRLRDAATPAPVPQASLARPAPLSQSSVVTRWRFGRSEDPVTRAVTQYANLVADPLDHGAPGGQMIQARCAGRRLQILFENGRLPLRNELSGRLRATLMEINFDDRVVQRLIWQILERYPATAIDPFGVGGLIALGGMFEPGLQRASTDWNATWLLDMLAGSDRVVLRVWDARHGAHVLRFSPRAPIADFRRNLSDCLQ